MIAAMKFDIHDAFQRMASTGQAPSQGCSILGVGYDDAFARLRQAYLVDAFARESASQKFVVGPFGSGKTHFLRRLQELAHEEDCVTAEVPLTKQVDFTKHLVRYQEVARYVQPPGSNRRGMRALLDACLKRVRAGMPAEHADTLVRGWAQAAAAEEFELQAFSRVASRTALAILDGDEDLARDGCEWLQGTVTDVALARRLGVPKVVAARADLHGQQALLSLFQLVRFAGFRGTVVCFDEAEQGLSVDRRRSDRVMQILQADSNAFDQLRGGSALLVYAVTPDVIQNMMNFAALQQRISDPGPGYGFFDGFTIAPVINLAAHRDAERDLVAIGRRLAEVYWSRIASSTGGPPSAALQTIESIA